MAHLDTLVIKYLVESNDSLVNISGVAKSLGVDYKNVYLSISRLKKKGLISTSKFGNSKILTLTSKLHPLIFDAEFLRKEQVLKNKDIRIIFDEVKKLNSSFFMFLLFGSYASFSQRKGSDIDLLFVVPGSVDDFELNLNRVFSRLPLNIHLLVFSESEFKDMVFANSPNVAKEAIRSCIVLHGLEYFYDLKNAKPK